MSSLFYWIASLFIVVAFGMAGADEYEEQQRAAAHKKEVIAAARNDSAQEKKMAAIEKRLKEMTAFDKIGMK